MNVSVKKPRAGLFALALGAAALLGLVAWKLMSPGIPPLGELARTAPREARWVLVFSDRHGEFSREWSALWTRARSQPGSGPAEMEDLLGVPPEDLRKCLLPSGWAACLLGTPGGERVAVFRVRDEAEARRLLQGLQERSGTGGHLRVQPVPVGSTSFLEAAELGGLCLGLHRSHLVVAGSAAAAAKAVALLDGNGSGLDQEVHFQEACAKVGDGGTFLAVGREPAWEGLAASWWAVGDGGPGGTWRSALRMDPSRPQGPVGKALLLEGTREGRWPDPAARKVLERLPKGYGVYAVLEGRRAAALEETFPGSTAVSRLASSVEALGLACGKPVASAGWTPTLVCASMKPGSDWRVLVERLVQERTDQAAAEAAWDCGASLDGLAGALKAYAGLHGYPKTLDRLVPGTLAQLPACPTTGEDSYSRGYYVDKARKRFALFCTGPHSSGSLFRASADYQVRKAPDAPAPSSWLKPTRKSTGPGEVESWPLPLQLAWLRGSSTPTGPGPDMLLLARGAGCDEEAASLTGQDPGSRRFSRDALASTTGAWALLALDGDVLRSLAADPREQRFELGGVELRAESLPGWRRASESMHGVGLLVFEAEGETLRSRADETFSRLARSLAAGWLVELARPGLARQERS